MASGLGKAFDEAQRRHDNMLPPDGEEDDYEEDEVDTYDYHYRDE